VESPLSKKILAGEFQAGDHVLADMGEATGDERGLLFSKQAPIAVELPVSAEEAVES